MDSSLDSSGVMCAFVCVIYVGRKGDSYDRLNSSLPSNQQTDSLKKHFTESLCSADSSLLACMSWKLPSAVPLQAAQTNNSPF